MYLFNRFYDIMYFICNNIMYSHRTSLNIYKLFKNNTF